MKRPRGVALIMALVVVALATVFATRIGADGALGQRRGIALLTQDGAFQLALGAEAWAIEILRDDAASTKVDALNELWAQPLPPIPVEDGTIAGRIEDMQGRFNVNNLVNSDGTKNQQYFDQFTRLLVAVGLEPDWASKVIDWIDPDSNVDGINGAEDSVYLSQAPPYRAANHMITSTSELLALPGFGIERYRHLQPFIAALPNGTHLNICTASGVVLDSLAPGLNIFSGNPEQLAKNRLNGCFPTRADIDPAISQLITAPGGAKLITDLLDTQTQWFRATIVVSLPTAELRLYSLMQRIPGGFSRVVVRTLGSE